MPPDKYTILNHLIQKRYYTTIAIRKPDLDELVERTDMSSFHLDSKVELAICHITAMVRGSTVTEIEYPLDWWQAFRERWLPNWWLKRYPVDCIRWQIDRHYPPAYPEGITRVYNNKKDLGYLHA